MGSPFVSLALATLIYEWRRYLAAIIALALSGLLVMAFIGLFLGIGKAVTATIDRARAEIMILSPKSESLLNGGSTGLPKRIRPLIYLNPEVKAIGELGGDGASWNNRPTGGAKRVHTYVDVWVVDTDPGAVTLPTDYTEANRLALSEPYAVAIDQSALAGLGVKLGDAATMNRRTVNVRTILHNYPSVTQPSVVISRQTEQLMGMASTSQRGGPLMVQLRHPEMAETVRDQLNAVSNGQYRAWTREELSKANESALLKEQIIGIILVFAVLLGTGIGIGITWQTLRGAIFANIKEFASLRALGVSMGSLRLVVMELSFWVGVVGALAAGVFIAGVGALASAGGLPMSFPVPILIEAAIGLILVAVISGFLSLGVLKQSQPADLLR
jgi:putative ABC transport system permease protein